MKAIVAGAAAALGSLTLLAACRESSHLQASEARSPEAVATEASSSMLVNCGPGQQALVRTVQISGRTLPQVECVALAPSAAPLYTDSPSLAQPVTYRTPALPVIERAAAPAQVVYRDRPVTYTRATRAEPVRVSQTRSWKKSALIIGGAAAGGAGVGAIVDGGQGAKRGAVIGGVAGTIYDIATRTKN